MAQMMDDMMPKLGPQEKSDVWNYAQLLTGRELGKLDRAAFMALCEHFFTVTD